MKLFKCEMKNIDNENMSENDFDALFAVRTSWEKKLNQMIKNKNLITQAD